MQKLFKKLPVFIFLILHFSFLIVSIIENKDKVFPAILLSGIALFLCFFYTRKTQINKSRIKKIDFILIFATISGAILTYWLNIKFSIGVVLAAGLVGFISSFIPFLERKSDVFREIPVAMYCGAFAGMTAPFIAHGYTFIFFAGLLSGLLLVISKDTFQGYGGKLGTIAFGGVSIFSIITLLF